MDRSEDEKQKDCEAGFVLSPSRREAARREQAKRDNRKKRGAPGSSRLRPGAEQTDRRPQRAAGRLHSRRGLDGVAEGAKRDNRRNHKGPLLLAAAPFLYLEKQNVSPVQVQNLGGGLLFILRAV